MNVKKYFTIILCVLGVCLAIISGVIVASKMVAPMGGADAIKGIDERPTKDRINVLILGVDGGEMRTDTIMFASLDNKNKKLSVMSIPRDTRVLDGNQYDKITHLYSGPKREEATINAVKRILGVPVHYCVLVDFKGFREAIDILGGVYIDVPNVPSVWSHGRKGMYYSDPAQNLNINLKEGYQLLDGKKAEEFVRFRYGYAEGDLGRIKAQQYFMKELLKQKLKPQYLLKAPELYKKLKSCVKTNFSLGDLTQQLITIKSLDPEQVKTFQLPGYPEYASTRYGVLSCFIYDRAKTDEIVSQYFMSSKSE